MVTLLCCLRQRPTSLQYKFIASLQTVCRCPHPGFASLFWQTYLESRYSVSIAGYRNVERLLQTSAYAVIFVMQYASFTLHAGM